MRQTSDFLFTLVPTPQWRRYTALRDFMQRVQRRFLFMLIKAEAYARQNKLPEALIELNKVITKKPADDPFGVGADLPPIAGPLTQAQLLTEIYRQRSIELFMSGLRLEDMRRLGRPTTERKRNFFPYPFQERDNNPNTPPNPTF